MKLLVDGGNLGRNPSRGIYWSLAEELPNGAVVRHIERHLEPGFTTNNQAECLAIRGALRWGLQCRPPQVDIWSDSRLVVEMIAGRCRCHAADLQPLVADCRTLRQGLVQQGTRVTLQWHSRKHSVAALGH